MKFAIVTPAYNASRFIRESIESVISQEGDFEIDYVVMDGGSKDNSVEIIEEYDRQIKDGKYPIKCKKVTFSWKSNGDKGMYDAINRGFTLVNGDVCAYLNADDVYLPGTLALMAKAFKQFPKIEWLKGTTSFIDEESKVYKKGACYLYNQKWIRMGIYGRNAYFIQQDSVFWRRSLWEKMGAEIDSDLRLAGDYFLWIQFSKYAPLWSINKEVSYFRKSRSQLSAKMEGYRKEQASISKPTGLLNFRIKLFFWVRTFFPGRLFNPIFGLLYRILFKNLNLEYVEVKSDGNIVINKAKSYSI